PAQILFKKLPMRHVEGHIEEDFGLPCALGANARILLDQRLYFLLKGFSLDDMIYQPDFIGATPVNIVARQRHLFRPAESDIARQSKGAQPGDDALLDRRQPQLTALSSDADGTGQRQLQSTAQGVAAHGADQNTLGLLDDSERPIPLLVIIVWGLSGDELLEVNARRESAARAADHRHP